MDRVPPVWKLVTVCTAVFLAAAPVSANASPISYSFSSSASGIIDGVAFDTDFTITTTGDTSNVQTLMSDLFVLENDSASIFINGFGSFNFQVQTATFFSDTNDGFDIFGFSLSALEPTNTLGFAVDLFWGAKNISALDGWDLQSSIGPISSMTGEVPSFVNGSQNHWTVFPILLDDGRALTLDTAAHLYTTVEAFPAVPLPAALPLFMSGLGLLGFLGWRRKRMITA